jgi:putative ABC transport system substrate-binding protein
MRRRELFGVVAGAVILLPVASRAQHLDRVSHVGVLMGFAENRPETQEYVAAFAKALEGYGWVEGKNLRIDYRFFPATDPTLFDRSAAELVAMPRAKASLKASRGRAVTSRGSARMTRNLRQNGLK